MTNDTINIENSINYVEFPMIDPEKTQAFYHQAFGWVFTSWGDDYLSFVGAGVEGGFNREEGIMPSKAGVLVILYTKSLEEKYDHVVRAGGVIEKPIFAFPGGRRFHFLDPNGNELAVWSEK